MTVNDPVSLLLWKETPLFGPQLLETCQYFQQSHIMLTSARQQPVSLLF